MSVCSVKTESSMFNWLFRLPRQKRLGKLLRLGTHTLVGCRGRAASHFIITASLHQGVQMGTGESWGVIAMEWHPVQGEYKFSQSYNAREIRYKHRPDEPY